MHKGHVVQYIVQLYGKDWYLYKKAEHDLKMNVSSHIL